MSSDRLRKALLMLSSSYDGEIIGAAKAIGRLLEKDGIDLFWLADCVETCPHRVAATKAKSHPDRTGASQPELALASRPTKTRWPATTHCTKSKGSSCPTIPPRSAPAR